MKAVIEEVNITFFSVSNYLILLVFPLIEKHIYVILKSKLLMSFQQRTVDRLVLLEGVNSALLEKSGHSDVPAGLDISAEALVTTWTCRSTGVLTQLDVTAEYAAIHAESWCFCLLSYVTMQAAQLE